MAPRCTIHHCPHSRCDFTSPTGSYMRVIASIFLNLIRFGTFKCMLLITTLTRLSISLLHPGDPPTGYPLTLQITPPLLNICRACTKVPAVYSIAGDIRLGESPCVLCAPCWRNMGPPNGPNSERVIISPLLKHKLGW